MFVTAVRGGQKFEWRCEGEMLIYEPALPDRLASVA
jgi:hypothetical protein